MPLLHLQTPATQAHPRAIDASLFLGTGGTSGRGLFLSWAPGLTAAPMESKPSFPSVTGRLQLVTTAVGVKGHKEMGEGNSGALSHPMANRE